MMKMETSEIRLESLKEAVASALAQGRLQEAKSVLEKAASVFPIHDDGYDWIIRRLARLVYEDGEADLKNRTASALKLLEEAGLAEPSAVSDDIRLFRAFAEACCHERDYPCSALWLEKLKRTEMTEDIRDEILHSLVSITVCSGIPMPEDGDSPGSLPPWAPLADFMGDDAVPALRGFRDKAGLALSGGGFRASLYHLGVLARLAEMDALRDMEVISTVSGGSIVGALYYLKVKELLETQPDDAVDRVDYIRIVQEIQELFLAGIGNNIRLRAFSEFRKNLKTLSQVYNRSHCLGDLYEEYFYSGYPATMPELLIHPVGETQNFKPRHSNWRRKAKVPVLLINATSLNTGHAWHFTASFMGEPPGLLKNAAGDSSKVDKNARYRRVRYAEAPTEELQNYRLGYAVAASACVPGLFQPLTVQGLYPEKLVRLVDGGVHDNQGAAGLLNEACTFIFCSDASGQMHDVDIPSDGMISVPLRSVSITMDRVREEQYQKLRAELLARQLRGLFFVHLKKDFPDQRQNWIGYEDVSPEFEETDELPYGITLNLQRKIAEIRTDLDSFTETEASALMTSGYQMAAHEARAIQERCRHAGLSEPWGGYDVDMPRLDEDETLPADGRIRNRQWNFLKLLPLMNRKGTVTEAGRDLENQLAVGAAKAFKIWRLHRVLRLTRWPLAIAALWLLFLTVRAGWTASFTLSTRWIITGAVLAAVPFGIGALSRWFGFLAEKMKWKHLIAVRLLRFIYHCRSGWNIIRDLFFAVIGAGLIKVYLKTFDRMYLRHGRMDRLLNSKKKDIY